MARMAKLEPAPASQRMFFALWPEPPLAGKLFDLAGCLATECGGRIMRRETVHMTLAFLGEVPSTRLPDLHEAGESLTMPAFDFVLDRLGWWPHNRIVWAGATQPPRALIELAGTLREALRRRALISSRDPFAPHVTLLRKAVRKPLAGDFAALPWPVREVVLVASRPSDAGVSYTRLAAWPLVGTAVRKVGPG